MWKTIHRSLLVSKHACIYWAQNLLPSTWHMWYIIVPGDSRLISYISSNRISSALASGKRLLCITPLLSKRQRVLRGNRELSHWNTVGKHLPSHRDKLIYFFPELSMNFVGCCNQSQNTKNSNLIDILINKSSSICQALLSAELCTRNHEAGKK